MRNQDRTKTQLLLISGLMIAALVVSGPWSTKAILLLAPQQTDEPIEMTPATRARVSEAFGKLPLYFLENRGQLDKRVGYYVQGSDKTIYFSDRGLTFVLAGRGNAESPQFASFNPQSPSPDRQSDRWALKLDFVGARAGARPEGQKQTGATFNYFKGPSSKWQTGLKSYSEVVYRDLWPGIDLVYAGNVNRMKYTFVVKPGADPDQIKLAWRGASGVKLNAAGELEVRTPAGGFTDERPVSWQRIDGRQVDVTTTYQFEDGGLKIENRSTQLATGNGRDPQSRITYGFNLGEYDRSRELVIDPTVLVYCGFLGGSGTGRGIAVDSVGNAYVTGLTAPPVGFPVIVGPDLTHNGSNDAFVAKVNADGTALVYCGYIGGDSFDQGIGIAVDGAGNAYVIGRTNSHHTTFPVTIGPDVNFNGGDDVFVAKVNAAGTALDYCGYIGGSGGDFAAGIAVDSMGNAYVTGSTTSTEASFPETVGPNLMISGSQDAFVAKVNAAGTALDYCGYIGGSSGSTAASGVAVDSAGNAYVTGQTSSNETTFPVTVGPDLTFNGGFVDAFVAKINAAGTALDYCGYIGGSGSFEAGFGIAIDSAGNAYITGVTESSQTTFPVTVGPDLTHNGGLLDAFVAKVNANGLALDYCGYIGGSGGDEGVGIAVDSAGSAYVTGRTGSTQASFPVTGGPDLTFNGGQDSFVAKINTAGSALDYCGYIGGSNFDFGFGIAVDSAGNAYVTGETSSTEATFPVTVGPDLTANGLNTDVFVAKVHQSPEDQLSALSAAVEALITAGTLTKGQGGGLNNKLDGVLSNLDKGQTQAACNQLNAFIKQVEGFIKSGALTSAQGQALIDAANIVKTNIGC